MHTHPSWPRTKWELVFPEKCLHLISLTRIQWEPLHSSSSSSSSSLHLSLFSSAWLLSGCISEATDALHRPWKGIQSNHLSSLTGNAKALWWMWSVPAWVHGRSPICSKVGDDVSGITMGGKQLLSCYLIFGSDDTPENIYGHQGFVLFGISAISRQRQHQWKDQDNSSQDRFALKGYSYQVFIHLTINCWDFYCHFL